MRKWMLALLAISSLPMLYVMSTGPALWLSNHRVISASSFGVAYQPVDDLCRSRPIIGHAIYRYLEPFRK
jgi:hypothetical protein